MSLQYQIWIIKISPKMMMITQILIWILLQPIQKTTPTSLLPLILLLKQPILQLTHPVILLIAQILHHQWAIAPLLNLNRCLIRSQVTMTSPQTCHPGTSTESCRTRCPYTARPSLSRSWLLKIQSWWSITILVMQTANKSLFCSIRQIIKPRMLIIQISMSTV